MTRLTIKYQLPTATLKIFFQFDRERGSDKARSGTRVDGFYLGSAVGSARCCRWRGGRTGSLKTKGAGWRFRTVGTSAQHTKKYRTCLWNTEDTLKSSRRPRGSSCVASQSQTLEGVKSRQRAQDTAGKQLWLGKGEEEESLVGQEARRVAVRLSLLLRVIFGALTSLTDAVTCG